MQGVYLVANMVEQVHSTSLRENTAECPYSLEKSPSATVQEQNGLCTEANLIAQASFLVIPQFSAQTERSSYTNPYIVSPFLYRQFHRNRVFPSILRHQ